MGKEWLVFFYNKDWRIVDWHAYTEKPLPKELLDRHKTLVYIY